MDFQDFKVCSFCKLFKPKRIQSIKRPFFKKEKLIVLQFTILSGIFFVGFAKIDKYASH